MSRSTITIMIWTITAGTKASRSGSKASRAKTVNRVNSGPLTIRCHDREQLPPARELRCSFFVSSLGCSRSHVTIVSMLLELVIIKCLQDFISSRGLGRSRSYVTIVSKHPSLWPSACQFPKKSGTLTIWCHDREHACWARDHISSKSKIDSGALMIHVMIVSMSLQFVTPCRFELQRLVTYVTIVRSNITTVSRHTAGFPGIVWKYSYGRWSPTQRLQQPYFWRVVYINSFLITNERLSTPITHSKHLTFICD